MHKVRFLLSVLRPNFFLFLPVGYLSVEENILIWLARLWGVDQYEGQWSGDLMCGLPSCGKLTQARHVFLVCAYLHLSSLLDLRPVCKVYGISAPHKTAALLFLVFFLVFLSPLFLFPLISSLPGGIQDTLTEYLMVKDWRKYQRQEGLSDIPPACSPKAGYKTITWEVPSLNLEERSIFLLKTEEPKKN